MFCLETAIKGPTVRRSEARFAPPLAFLNIHQIFIICQSEQDYLVMLRFYKETKNNRNECEISTVS